MYRAKQIQTDDKALFYKAVLHLLENLVTDEPDWLANVCNAAALLGHQLTEINWVGFYVYKQGELVLGPFQGKPACTHIPVGSGVCGTAAQRRQTVLVPDVEAFPGHIACDSASRSEIVVPIINQDGKLLGVLDVDSPVLNRFDDQDATGLEQVAQRLASLPGWPAADCE
ncbi:MAG TPA: GAF domain-containing protein [Firmicutes bacterium]|nr:GAF domain-containing protein [Bacillota bacterium]